MWTLAQARERLGRRLAEVSTTFWDNTERNNAVNDAMRLIASLTRGIPEVVTGDVNTTTNYVTYTGTPVGEYVTAGVADGSAMSVVPMNIANAMYPEWRTAVGDPRWALVDTRESRVYIAPVPSTSVEVTVTVAVLPPELTVDNEPLFLGQASMERYQTALLNMAAAYCLLRERYDGDAERFWQFGIQELQMLGVEPNTVPPLREAAQ